jgi:hypothetical protein
MLRQRRGAEGNGLGSTIMYLRRRTRQRHGHQAQLYRINVLHHEALGGKYVPCAALFDLEPSAIDAARASPLGELFR